VPVVAPLRADPAHRVRRAARVERGPARGARRLACAVVAAALSGTLPNARASDAPPAADSVPRIEHPCPAPSEVVLRAASDRDARWVCEGIRRALAFLGGVGLAAPPQVRVEVGGALPGGLDGRAVGCFLRETRRIHLIGWAEFEALGEWFRTPVDTELYRAAALHETAHAVVACSAEPAMLPLAAHEYVAYVTMFATMAPELRARVLARVPGTGFRSTLQINAAVYRVDPLQFAADAWRDDLGRRDRGAWLRDLVAGRIVQPTPEDAP